MMNMKVSAQEKKEMAAPSVVSDKEQYPYGLKIHLDSESYKKLGLKEAPKIGEKFMILAVAEVCDIHQEKYEGDVPEICMGMQITDMDLKKKDGEDRNIAKEIYGSDEG